ncbi:hypothetical protein LDENG_00024780 [Lucifuga dentata]|nr:hypothetical protein LDENG_00024780 [Lucifuga dentata]
MATAGSAERPRRAGSAAAGSSAFRSGSRAAVRTRAEAKSSPPEEDEPLKKCSVCVEAEPCKPPCGHPACPLCLAREERLWRRTDPERSSSRPCRRDCDRRTEFFVSPALIPKCGDVMSSTGKHKLLMAEDRDESRRRSVPSCKEECGSVRHNEDPRVLSDSENEEPLSRRTRNISAFVRKTKTSSAFTGCAQRSLSCTDSVEDGGRKLKVVSQPALRDTVGISHSYTAGILLSSENSQSISASVAVNDRKLTWCPVVTSLATPLGIPQSRSERSISPESNDSISEELNHFKPIVCSPCTPPKRLPDGRLMEPTIIKSTPRNLARGLQRATSYEASPTVLQKWRQIELDRQRLKVNSKATLTSPVNELHAKMSSVEDGTAGRDGDRVFALNKRKLVFEQPAAETNSFQKQSVKIRVPAIRYSSKTSFRGSSDSELAVVAAESCSGALFSNKQSFSPYKRNSGFQSCKLTSKDSQSPRKESNGSNQNQSTSRKGKKRSHKTKHLDLEADLKRTRPVSQEALVVDELYIRQIQIQQQERQDRALALQLQRQFDLENHTTNRRRSPDKYFLRSWMSNQNRRKHGLRRSRRISKKH